MAVKIRLSRIGKKGVPFYRIVAVDERKKRDGSFLEDLGTYDALANKMVTLREDRVEDWISKGAIPTDALKRIYKKHKKATMPEQMQPKASKAKASKKEDAQA